MEFLIKFIYPYSAYLIGAAYNVQQTIEGAGLGSSSFLVRDGAGRITEGYWSPSQALAEPLAILFIYSLILIVGICVAGYALARRKGLLMALFILCFPGLLSMFGFWPEVNFLPEVYHIGGVGSLGSPYGMAALAAIALLSGWTCVVIATDAFCLQDKFRHVYDHLWYSMAILAGLFFVADAGVSQEVRDLQDTTKHVQQASSYLISQVKEYSKFCRAAAIEKRPSCAWANDVQQELADYAAYDDRLYWQLGPKSSSYLYAPFGNESKETELEIRGELEQFNQLQCPSTKNRMAMPSNTCQRPPAIFCTGTDDGNNMVRTVAVSNECVVPTLVALRVKMEKQVDKVEAAARAKHARWLFYIFFAFLAGGKVANATAKLTKSRSGQMGLGDECNTKPLALKARNAVCNLLIFIYARICAGYRFIRRFLFWAKSIAKISKHAEIDAVDKTSD